MGPFESNCLFNPLPVLKYFVTDTSYKKVTNESERLVFLKERSHSTTQRFVGLHSGRKWLFKTLPISILPAEIQILLEYKYDYVWKLGQMGHMFIWTSVIISCLLSTTEMSYGTPCIHFLLNVASLIHMFRELHMIKISISRRSFTHRPLHRLSHRTLSSLP